MITPARKVLGGTRCPKNPDFTISEAELTNTTPHMFGSPKERLVFYRREIHYETSILANRN